MNDESHADAAVTAYQCAVFSVLDFHSRLDLNLGLCIAHLSRPEDPPSAYTSIEKLSCFDKIEALRKLVPDELSISLEEWAKTAMDVRALRNQFAHGIWEYLPLISSAPIGLRMPPWYALGDRTEFRFSVSEIQEMAEDVKACFESFMKWRRAHRI